MIGYWMDAVECGCRFGRDRDTVARAPYPLPLKEWDLLVLHEKNRDPVWVHGHRIGCYIRDAWLRLR